MTLKKYIIILTLVVLVLAGCSKAEYSIAPQADQSSDNYSYADNKDNMKTTSTSESKSTNGSAGTDSPETQDKASTALEGQSGAPGITDRKIIREQTIEQEVKDLKQVIIDVENQLQKIDGAYMQDQQEWKVENNHATEYRAQLIMRVPVNKLKDFTSSIEKLGNVLERRQTGQDVTAEYIDNESRLRNLNAHEQRILQLYQKAEKIDEMLQIEAELARIRGSIEEIEGRQKYLSEVTSTAKITLNLVQVKEYDLIQGQLGTSTLEQAWIGLKKSLLALVSISQGLFIFIIASFPFLVIIGLLVTVIYLIVRKLRTRRRKEKQKNDIQD